MDSSSDKGSSASHKKLNPQAVDFIPVATEGTDKVNDKLSESPQAVLDEVNERTNTPSDTLSHPIQKKNRRRRTRRRGYNHLDLSKPFIEEDTRESKSEDKKSSSTHYVPIVDKGVGATNITVAKRAPTTGQIGIGPRDQGNDSPQYGNALTWKSNTIKAQEEFARIRRNVQAIAPELFRDRARPTNEKADIFPTTLSEYQLFKSESLKDRLRELTEDTKKMADMVKAAENMEKDGITKDKRIPKSVFGSANGKVFKDGLGPVLAQPTIWSEEFIKSDVPKAAWPSRAELLEEGGRKLPKPRYPRDSGAAYDSSQSRVVVPENPLDQTGPIYRNALGQVTEPSQEEVDKANEDMDNDPTFEGQALLFLGSDLMDEVGRWKPSGVPEWQKRQRQEQQARDEAAKSLLQMRQDVSGLHLGESRNQGDGQALPQYAGSSGHTHGPYQDGTGQAQPEPSPYQGQANGADGMHLPAHAAYAQSQGQAAVNGNNTNTSNVRPLYEGIGGWRLIGRHTVAGTNIGENIWMSPEGRTVTERNGHWSY